MNAPPVAEPTRDLDAALAQILVQIDDLLSSYPTSGLDARRRITCELHFEPRAEELQTFARIAEDPSSEGPRFELPRSLLALRLVADRELKRLYDPVPPEREVIEQLAQILPDIADEARRTEVRLTEIAVDDNMLHADREYLVTMGDALTVQREQLVTATVIARQLAEIDAAAAAGSLESATRFLDESQRETLAGWLTRSAIGGDEPVRGGDTSRGRIDALLLRAHVGDLLAQWARLGSPSEDDDERRAVRDVLIDRMQRARIAIETTSARIQDQQDEALVARLHALAEELREAGRCLFSSKLLLAPILRAPYDEPDDGDDVDSVLARLEEQFPANHKPEPVPARESNEELFIGALRDMGKSRSGAAREPRLAGASRKGQEKRRLLLLAATAGVLAVVSAAVNIMLAPGAARPPQPPTAAELQPIVNAAKVEAAGPVLFTQVENWSELDEGRQQGKIGQLGQSVSSNGFGSVFVIDESGATVGTWTHQSGAVVIDRSE